ncbi:hypothetical protein K9M74_04260 [Candidatus Woesearchaeota archaeon]|nr:hypothetical protein [Candidatus Woesearchaeota archaeon]
MTNDNNFALIALVAIVAVVGLVGLVMMQGGAKNLLPTIVTTEDNLAGDVKAMGRISDSECQGLLDACNTGYHPSTYNVYDALCNYHIAEK